MARRIIAVALLAILAGISVLPLRAADKGALRSAEAGCGPFAERFKVGSVHSSGEIEPPPAGKARVYVIDPEPLLWGGAPSTLTVGVDGRWVGALRGRTQFSLTLDPGEHHFCVRAEGVDVPRRGGAAGDAVGLLGLDLAAGQTVYVITHLERNALDSVTVSGNMVRIWQTNPDEGRLLVSSAALGTMRRRR